MGVTVLAWTAEANQSNAYFDGADGAGDVDGDGYDDLIIGARDYQNGHGDEVGSSSTTAAHRARGYCDVTSKTTMTTPSWA